MGSVLALLNIFGGDLSDHLTVLRAWRNRFRRRGNHGSGERRKLLGVLGGEHAGDEDRGGGVRGGGGLRVGKEGPLAHIGSLVGVACLYIPWGLSKPFRNDRDKRDFIAAGAGVGCAVAFGAPIGGVLYAYEVSKANTFWTFSLAWQTFLATSLANFTLTFCNALTTGNFTNVTNAGLIRLGEISKNNNYNLADVIVFIFIGILGGLFGALFNEINIRLAKLRIKHLKTKIAKYFEAILFAFVGSTIIFYLPALFPCTEFPLDTEIGTRYQCPEDQVNEMATLLFNTEGDTLKYLLKAANNSDFMVALTFLLVWFFFTATTYGVSVPSGLFFPGLVDRRLFG